MAETDRGLVLLDRANQLLSEANSLDDLKEVRDTAEAARTFAKAARLGLQLQNRAAELKLRAERKAGAFLAELHLRGGDRRSKPQQVTLKLDDLGVTKRQSELWQLAASVPENEFERYVHGKNQLGEELTAAGLLRIAKLRLQRPKPSAGQPPRCSPDGREALVSDRAELLSVVNELKTQFEHLSALLKPLQANQEGVYRPAERRYIGRLTRDIELGIQQVQSHLWKMP